MPDAPAPRASASHALCVYAEALVQGRRVFVVDDASRGMGARLLELGARVVHVYDPNGHRAREAAQSAPRGLSVQELPVSDFDVRDGAFDLAILTDLGLVADPPGLLARVRRVLGADGVALVCAANHEAPVRLVEPMSSRLPASRAVDYYELYDHVALQFANVRMVGLLPFVGVVLAELGLQGEPEVTVDTQLAGEGSAPELFVAIASQSSVNLSQYAIVQLPSDSLARAEEPSDAARLRVSLAEAQLRASVLSSRIEEIQTQALAAGQAEGARKLAELEAALTEARAQWKDAEGRAAGELARAERLGDELRRLGDELAIERSYRARLEADVVASAEATGASGAVAVADALARAAALEVALRAEEDVVAVLRGRLAEVDARASLSEEQVAALVVSLEEVRSLVVPPEEMARVSDLADRAEAAEGRVGALEAELSTIAESNAGELVQLETALRDRGKTIQSLEHELVRRERMVQELVATLEEHAHGASGAAHEGDALRELGHARSQIDALRRELEARTAPVAPADSTDEAVALRGKLDALALDAARREAELTARAWRITELEAAIADAKLSASDPAPAAGVDPGPLQDELFALRQALTQEHEARVQAESGAELEKARAELARQAVLIEQLSRELDGRDRARAAEASRA